VDRLEWDVGLYLTVTGATHDAAIVAWELKRDSLAPRPITLIRHMAQLGQRTDDTLPNYNAGGLPLIDDLIEVITEESSAPGERHEHLRWYVGELAVRAWRGEPGDRANDYTPVGWMRALEWIPYQRRTFVTPAFPGFISGHSTFSRAPRRRSRTTPTAPTSRAASTSTWLRPTSTSSSRRPQRGRAPPVGTLRGRRRPGWPVAPLRRHPHLAG
jgi:hypothetical protein